MITLNQKKVINFLFISSALIASHAIAKPFEGVIKGAECHFYGKFCSESASDIKAQLEKDFILVSDNRYFLLKDLPFSEKVRLNNKMVRVYGDSQKNTISVSRVKTKSHNGSYHKEWDWNESTYGAYEFYE